MKSLKSLEAQLARDNQFARKEQSMRNLKLMENPSPFAPDLVDELAQALIDGTASPVVMLEVIADHYERQHKTESRDAVLKAIRSIILGRSE